MSRSAVIVLVALSLGLSACGSSPPKASVSDAGGAATSSPVAGSTSTTTSTLRPCRSEVSTCRGELAAGTYASTRTDLIGTGAPGQVTVTVPSGWANSLDHQPAYWVRPAADYFADPATDGNGTSSGVYVWADVAAARQGGACTEASEPGVGTDARSLATWVPTVPGVVATPRPAAKVGGLAALVTDLQLGPKPPSCEGSPYVPLVANRPGAPDPYAWGLGGDDRARLWLVDLGGGHTTTVFVIGAKAPYAGLLARALPVVASLKLSHG